MVPPAPASVVATSVVTAFPILPASVSRVLVTPAVVFNITVGPIDSEYDETEEVDWAL